MLQTPSHTLQPGADQVNLGRDPRPPIQRGNIKDYPPTRGVLLRPVSGPQKRWRSQTGDQSKGSEPIYSASPFQNGRRERNERPDKTERLASEGRPKRRLLRNTNPPKPQEVPQILHSARNISVQLPAVRPIISSMGLYQDPQTDDSVTTGVGSTPSGLYGRHTVTGRVQRITTEPGSRPGIRAPMPGLHCEQQEISSNSHTITRFSGVLHRHHDYGDETTGRQIEGHSDRSPQIGQGRVDLSPSPFTITREDECHITGDPPGSPLLPSPPKVPLRLSGPEFTELQCPVMPFPEVQGGTDMVGHPHVQVEWEIPHQEGSGPNHRLRCLQHRLGSILWTSEDRRFLVFPGEHLTHQLPRTTSSHPGSLHLCKEQIQNHHTAENRQHVSSSLYQQQGWDSVPGPSQPDQGSVDVVPGEEHPHHSPTPPRDSEHHCRHGVPDNGGLVGLEAERGNLPVNRPAIWPNRSGPICIQTNNSVPHLFQLAARSVCSSYRCLPSRLVNHLGICEPPLVPNREGSSPDPNATSLGHSPGTSLEITTLVSSTPGDGGVSSPPNQTSHHPGSRPTGITTAPTSHLEYLRSHYRDQELSEEAMTLVLNSWRSKTNKSYNSLFWRWCREHGHDPISGPVTIIANFLAHPHSEGYK